MHCVKSVRIWIYPGPHFPAFGQNTDRYSVSLRIQSKCGKMRTRITPNTGTFHAWFKERARERESLILFETWFLFKFIGYKEKSSRDYSDKNTTFYRNLKKGKPLKMNLTYQENHQFFMQNQLKEINFHWAICHQDIVK